MHDFQPTTKGFTLAEVLVVISIVVVIASITLVGFRNFASYQQYKQAVGDVQFTLTQTRLSARSAELDEAHGVKFTASSMTRFVGETYTPGDPQNQVINYSLVTLSPSLTGGTDEIVFAKLTGLPSATGTIEIAGVQYEASTTVEVTEAGVIQ